MIASIILIAVADILGLPEGSIRDAGLERARVPERLERETVAIFRSASRGGALRASLDVGVASFSSNEEAEAFRRDMEPASLEFRYTDAALSGLPTAVPSASFGTTRSWSQWMRFGMRGVKVRTTLSAGGGRNPEAEEAFAQLAEGVARHVAAAHLAEGLNDPGERRVGNKTLTRLLRTREGRDLVDVTEYAGAFGLPLRRNERLGTAIIEIGGRSVLLVLCADQAKVGTQWQTTGSAMLHRDNRWYAPLDWLESMRG